MRTVVAGAIVAVFLIGGNDANAQFVTLDRTASHSLFTSEFGVTVSVDEPDSALLRNDLYAHVESEGWGGCVSLPIAHLVGLGGTPTVVGNLGVGGFRAVDLGTVQVIPCFGAALALALASQTRRIRQRNLSPCPLISVMRGPAPH